MIRIPTLAACLCLAVLSLVSPSQISAAEDAPVQPMSQRLCSVYAMEADLTTIVDWMHGELGYPVRLSPAVAAADLPPFFMELNGIRLENQVLFMALCNNLVVDHDPESGWFTISQPKGRPQADTAKGPPFHGLLVDRTREPIAATGSMAEVAQSLCRGPLHPSLARALAADERQLGIVLPIPQDDEGWKRLDTAMDHVFDRIKAAPFHCLRQRIDLDVTDASPHHIVADLSTRCGIEIRIAGGFDRQGSYGMLPTLTIHAGRVTLETALELICAGADLCLAQGGAGDLVLHDDLKQRAQLAEFLAERAELQAEIAEEEAHRWSADIDPEGRRAVDEWLTKARARLVELDAEATREIEPFLNRRGGVHLKVEPATNMRLGDLSVVDADLHSLHDALEAAYGPGVGAGHIAGQAPPPLTLHLEDYELRDVSEILRAAGWLVVIQDPQAVQVTDVQGDE